MKIHDKVQLIKVKGYHNGLEKRIGQWGNIIDLSDPIMIKVRFDDGEIFYCLKEELGRSF